MPLPDVTVFDATEVVHHGAKLLKLLQRDDRCHSALVEPHLFEISERITRVPPARSCIAVTNEPTRLFLQVREKLQIRSAGVTRARVNICVVGGKNASHSFCLLLNKPVAIVFQEQVVFFVAIVDVEVLDARVQQNQLGALVLEVRPTAMLGC